EAGHEPTGQGWMHTMTQCSYAGGSGAGGGGGGGGQSSRPRLPKGTDKNAIKDFNERFDAALKRLEDPNSDCAKLFGGKDKAINALQNASYSYQNLGMGKVDQDGRLHVTGAATFGNTVFINTFGPFRNPTILVQTVSGVRPQTANQGLNNPVDVGALILLHELGHLLGIFKPDANNSELNQAQTQQVIDACFKE
ncbi:MAG TPA: hypothetical protein VFV34_00805, partial [Blastocatellia bacterium]|nr:hypothetical protein [Blastocatellia bacterium]